MSATAERALGAATVMATRPTGTAIGAISGAAATTAPWCGQQPQARPGGSSGQPVPCSSAQQSSPPSEAAICRAPLESSAVATSTMRTKDGTEEIVYWLRRPPSTPGSPVLVAARR